MQPIQKGKNRLVTLKCSTSIFVFSSDQSACKFIRLSLSKARKYCPPVSVACAGAVLHPELLLTFPLLNFPLRSQLVCGINGAHADSIYFYILRLCNINAVRIINVFRRISLPICKQETTLLFDLLSRNLSTAVANPSR